MENKQQQNVIYIYIHIKCGYLYIYMLHIYQFLCSSSKYMCMHECLPFSHAETDKTLNNSLNYIHPSDMDTLNGSMK